MGMEQFWIKWTLKAFPMSNLISQAQKPTFILRLAILPIDPMGRLWRLATLSMDTLRSRDCCTAKEVLKPSSPPTSLKAFSFYMHAV